MIAAAIPTPRFTPPELRQQPAADQRADDADDDIPQHAKTAAAHDKAREQTGNQTDQQPNKKRFGAHV
jgi:hypothetical protein